MVSTRLNTFDGNNQTSFLNLNSKLKIKDFVNSLCGILKTESVPDEIITEIKASLFNCVHSFTGHYQRLSSDKHRDEFRSAAKRHTRTLNSVLTYIVQSYKTDAYDTHIIVQNDNLRIEVGSLEVMSEKISPRSFKPWYNALKVLRHVGNGVTVNHTVSICRVLTSLYNIVNEPELRESEKTRQVKELVSLLSGEPRYSNMSDYINQNTASDPSIHQGIEEIKETVRLLKSYLDDPTLKVPLWASDMTRSLRALSRNRGIFLYDNNNSMLSSSSTCSTMVYRKKRVTIPGVFASCIEPDYFKDNYPLSNFDTITGFKQDYCISVDLQNYIDSKSKRRFSLAIKQKKPKVRIIHPLNNSEQDRLYYYHKLLSYVLERIPSDCTFDQVKGPQHIKYVMANERSWSIYSMDLTSATDTFSIGLQWLILKDLIFNSHENRLELSNDWLKIMTSETVIINNRKEIKFSFSNGQPQGFLSSFPSFALEHHVIMLTTLRLAEVEIPPDKAYRCLGDDGLLTINDPEYVIPFLYQRLMASANVECNLSKGYLYNPDNPDRMVKIAEFAKYLLLDGIELTPIPTKLLVTENKFNNYIALAAWYSIHRAEQWSVEEMKFFLEQMDGFDSEYYSPIIDIMVHLNVPGIFKESFKQKTDRLISGHSTDDIAIVQCLLTHSIIYAASNKLLSNKPYDNNIKTLIHLSSELKPFMEFIDDQSIISHDNKLSILKQDVERTYQTFWEVCRNYSTLEELSKDDILLVCMILQTNNTDAIKKRIDSILSGMYLLMIDPYQDVPQGEENHFMDRLLELYQNFSISIERSWSTLSKKIPVDYLQNSLREVDKILNKRYSISLKDYVGNNKMIIESSPGYYRDDLWNEFGLYDEGILSGRPDDEWDLFF